MISYRQADLLERLNRSFEVTFDFHFDQVNAKLYEFFYIPFEDDSLRSIFLNSQISTMWRASVRVVKFNPNDIIFKGCTANFDTDQWRDIHDILENFRSGMESAGYKIKKTEDNIFKSSRKDNEGSRYFTAYKVILPR